MLKSVWTWLIVLKGIASIDWLIWEICCGHWSYFACVDSLIDSRLAIMRTAVWQTNQFAAHLALFLHIFGYNFALNLHPVYKSAMFTMKRGIALKVKTHWSYDGFCLKTINQSINSPHAYVNRRPIPGKSVLDWLVDWMSSHFNSMMIEWLFDLVKKGVFFPLSIGGFLVAIESSPFHEKPTNHCDDEIKFWKHREQISRMSARCKTEILAQ